ncbi:MAG: hypothetical protein Q4C13_03930, partial [Clostridia bacterium]|nr:hypothetical protein [Clostridia bacterium]
MRKRFLAALLLLPLVFNAGGARAQEAVEEYTEALQFTDTRQGVLLRDGNVETRVDLPVRLELPDTGERTMLYLEWFSAPGRYTIEEYDAAGRLIASGLHAGGRLNICHPLSEGAASLLISGEAALATLRLVKRDSPPEDAHNWLP